MENPQCVLLNFVKVEDGDFEVKEEGADVEDENEVFEDDDPLAVDDDTTDLDALFASNYVETTHNKQPASVGSGGGVGVVGDGSTITTTTITTQLQQQQQQQQRRRLRFSDADDRLLLAQVAQRDPYRQAAHWRDITATVARSAGKAFSARAVREHTDHMMQCFALKGEDACLRRTPVEFWAQKKRLLHQVYQMWKNTARSVATALMAAAEKEPELEDEEETVVDASTLAAKTRAAKVSQTQKPNTPSRSVFLQQPLTLHLNGSQLRMACPPLQPLSAVPSANSVPALSGIQLQGLQRVTVAGGLAPALLSKSLILQSLQSPSAHSKATTVAAAATAKVKAMEQVTESTEQASKSTEESATTTGAATNQTMERACSPICIKEDKQDLTRATLKNQECEGQSSLSDKTSTGTQTEGSSAQRKKRLRYTTLMRARLQWECARQRNRVALRQRALRLEERRLALESRRLRLEERRWALELSERRQKMLMLKEERLHRMAMERRQQGMADALIALKCKD